VSSFVPWSRPTFSSKGEPRNAWFTGRAERQEKGLLRFDVLQRRLATALDRHPDDLLVIRAIAEVTIGITIEIEYLQFTRISDSSVAITDRAGATQFLDLDTGEYR
jgi:hypothetical protein